jgi:hypothetical protein
MELWENRVVNGVLKSGMALDAQEVGRLLASDVEIVADSKRAARDLWPCIWAVAAALTRQFNGTIFVRAGLAEALPGPSPLGARCRFVNERTDAAIRIGIGMPATDGESGGIWGDVHGPVIAYRRCLPGNESAHPISTFALAGYLSYAALAFAVGIPPFRDEFAVQELTFPIPIGEVPLSRGLTLIGLGQLGQAYLALLYFLAATPPRRLVFLDRDSFEPPNRHTQVLLDDDGGWVGKGKATFLEGIFRSLGWDAVGEVDELTWEWRRPAHHPGIAVLGLDDLDVRRMAVSAGYDWIVEAGIGNSFLQPRVSWHSLPPDGALARRLFAGASSTHDSVGEDSELARNLKDTPGQCGWVTFNEIRASAPSMGLVAAANAWCSVLEAVAGQPSRARGRACLWSPLLPVLRDDPC